MKSSIFCLVFLFINSSTYAMVSSSLSPSHEEMKNQITDQSKKYYIGKIVKYHKKNGELVYVLIYHLQGDQAEIRWLKDERLHFRNITLQKFNKPTNCSNSCNNSNDTFSLELNQSLESNSINLDFPPPPTNSIQGSDFYELLITKSWYENLNEIIEKDKAFEVSSEQFAEVENLIQLASMLPTEPERSYWTYHLDRLKTKFFVLRMDLKRQNTEEINPRKKKSELLAITKVNKDATPPDVNPDSKIGPPISKKLIVYKKIEPHQENTNPSSQQEPLPIEINQNPHMTYLSIHRHLSQGHSPLHKEMRNQKKEEQIQKPKGPLNSTHEVIFSKETLLFRLRNLKKKEIQFYFDNFPFSTRISIENEILDAFDEVHANLSMSQLIDEYVKKKKDAEQRADLFQKIMIEKDQPNFRLPGAGLSREQLLLEIWIFEESRLLNKGRLGELVDNCLASLIENSNISFMQNSNNFTSITEDEASINRENAKVEVAEIIRNLWDEEFSKKTFRDLQYCLKDNLDLIKKKLIQTGP